MQNYFFKTRIASLKLLVIVFLITFTSLSLLLNNYRSINNTDFNIFDSPKSSDLEITIKTPENITYTESMSGYYPALYGFENDDDGADPAEWDVFEGAGYVNVKDALGEHL